MKKPDPNTFPMYIDRAVLLRAQEATPEIAGAFGVHPGSMIIWEPGWQQPSSTDRAQFEKRYALIEGTGVMPPETPQLYLKHEAAIRAQFCPEESVVEGVRIPQGQYAVWFWSSIIQGYRVQNVEKAQFDNMYRPAADRSLEATRGRV